MKKKCIPLLLALCMVMSLLVLPASAAEPTVSGLYDIQTLRMGAVLTPQTIDNQNISGENVTINGARQVLYPNAERFELTIQGTPNAFCFVSVCAGDLAAPDFAKADYLNQFTADGDGKVTCAGLNAPFISRSGKAPAEGIHSVFVNDVKVATFCWYAYSTGVSVTGAVQGSNPNAGFRVAMKQNGAEVVGQDYRANGKSEPQRFTLAAVPAGTYDLVVSMKGHTDYVVHNVVVGENDLDLTAASSKPYSLMRLRLGSLNGDDVVNSADLNLIWSESNYGKQANEAQDPGADVNGDGVVNSADLNLLWSEENYGKGPADSEYPF